MRNFFICIVIAGSIFIFAAMARPVAQDAEDIINANADTLVITISASPRSVILHVPELMLEPPGILPDGTPASQDASITKEQGLEIVRYLSKEGLLRDAAKFCSPSLSEPETPRPKDSLKELPLGPALEHIAIRLDTNDGNWHTGYFIFLAKDKDAYKLLNAIKGLLCCGAKSEMEEFLIKIK